VARPLPRENQAGSIGRQCWQGPRPRRPFIRPTGGHQRDSEFGKQQGQDDRAEDDAVTSKRKLLRQPASVAFALASRPCRRGDRAGAPMLPSKPQSGSRRWKGGAIGVWKDYGCFGASGVPVCRCASGHRHRSSEQRVAPDGAPHRTGRTGNAKAIGNRRLDFSSRNFGRWTTN
jgi:hypothetical protein